MSRHRTVVRISARPSSAPGLPGAPPRIPGAENIVATVAIAIAFGGLIAAVFPGVAPAAVWGGGNTVNALGGSDSANALIRGLDHVPVAVVDLDSAVQGFRRLGFSIKPGRPHANGIRNAHLKFPDGTEIELITASEARDPLTEWYRAHIDRGEGPAFAALFAPDVERVARLLKASGRAVGRNGRLLTFPPGDSLRHLFFGGRNASPTDRPEHFRHPNGAASLVAIWLAGDDLSGEEALLALLGVPIRRDTLFLPERTVTGVAALPEGEIYILDGSRQWLPGRRVIGATVRVRDVEATSRILAGKGMTGASIVRHDRGMSLVVPPGEAHGLWLEFRQLPGSTDGDR